jgi:flagellar motor switch protein FliM
VVNESLSQNEIDLLFGAGGAPKAASPPQDRRKRQGGDLQVYDFRRPARISKDRKRSLMAMYGLLTKSLEGWITGRVRDQITLELQSVEQLTFGEFMLALPSPCAAFVADVGDPAGRQGVIEFGGEFAYFLVDRLLGGAGIPSYPDRPLSQLERLVVRIVAERVGQQLGDIWKDYVELEMEIAGFESIPEMLQAANREDPVLVANIEVTVQDTSSLLLLCLPFQTLEKFFTGGSERKSQTYLGTPEERHEDRSRLEENVRLSRLNVAARLPAFEVPVRQLAELTVGQILPTGLEPTTELELIVGEQRRYLGEPGRSGRNLAVRVNAAVPVEPEDLIHPTRQRISK